MAYYAQLKHGSRFIDLSTGSYRLGPGFVPPSTDATSLLSGGNMLNKYSGGKLISKKYNDRGYGLSIRSLSMSSALPGSV